MFRNLAIPVAMAVLVAGATAQTQAPQKQAINVPIQSGTYDFFNEEVLGEDANGDVIEPRQDYAASADDNQTIRSVTGAPGGMGYFGYSYFAENHVRHCSFVLRHVAEEAIAIATSPRENKAFSNERRRENTSAEK